MPEVCHAWTRLAESGLLVKQVMSVTSHASAVDMASLPHDVLFSTYITHVPNVWPLIME